MEQEDSSKRSKKPPRRSNTVGRPSVLSKKRIIDAARDMPFEQISFSAVAAKVGVSSQALYKYFPNAGALRAAIAATLATEIGFQQNWKPAPDTANEFIFFLEKLTKNYRAWLRVNNLSPKLFQIAYGATRFANGHETPVLLERLETFLHVAANRQVVDGGVLDHTLGIDDE